jgi:hypothetical protein
LTSRLGDRSIVVSIQEVEPLHQWKAKIRAPPIISCNVLDFVSILQESSLPEKKKMKSPNEFSLFLNEIPLRD